MPGLRIINYLEATNYKIQCQFESHSNIFFYTPRYIFPEDVFDSRTVPHCADETRFAADEEAESVMQIGVDIPVLPGQPGEMSASKSLSKLS